MALQRGLFDEPQPPQAGQHAPPGPSLLRHPRANRECRLGDVALAYEFRRARRKTIGLVVNTHGLSVRAPLWVPEAEVQRFLLAKAPWVLAKLQAVQARPQPPAMVWAQGASIDFLGQPLMLSLDPAHRFEGAGAGLQGSQLCVALPADCGPQRLRDTVQAWLTEQARGHLTQRLEHYAPVVGVRWTRLRLSSATTRWGSAHADGAIHLNWRLIHLAPELIDYVVVHELCHLHEMNHSPAFWRLVEAVLPDQAERRRALRRVTLLTLT